MNRRAHIHFVISLILLIGVGVAYYFWFYYVSSLSDRASALSNEIELKTEDSAQSVQAKNALASLSASETSIDTRFITSANIVPYLESVQETGKDLGSTIKVASVAEKDGMPVGTLSLTLTITGTFDSVVRTIGVLENATIDTSLTSLTLDTTPTTGSSTPVWTASTILLVGIQANASGTTGLPQDMSSMVPVASTTLPTSSSTTPTPVNATSSRPNVSSTTTKVIPSRNLTPS